MKSFFKGFFASLLALIVFFGLLFLVFLGIAAALVPDGKVSLESGTVLVLDLSRNYPERIQEDPIAAISGDPETPDFHTLLKSIEKATEDTSIKGIYLLANDNANGFAASGELRKTLASFRKKGKFVIAYGDYISQKAYYVASASSSIYCNPKGMFEWQGMSAEYVFFKQLIDRLEIKPQIFFAGKFKSATEPFRESAMTEANRIQTSVWLEDIYSDFLNTVAADRKLNADSLRQLAAKMSVSMPENAVRAGLLTGAAYDDEIRTLIRFRLGLKAKDKIPFMGIEKYAETVSLSGTYSKNRIALVIAEGNIVYGKGQPDEIGSDDYLALLRKLKDDASVKAIVLRINSPGGSSLASEIIWRELELIKASGKKVVVSMGDVAASGGYYIACNADKILVQPNTITGSIGVFSVIPDFSTFMKNKLGITFDRVSTSPSSDIPSVTRPMSENEKKIIQSEVDRIYSDFKGRVAKGRKKSVESIDSIAQGRVWTGKRALQIGLADELGGINEAVILAAKLAGVKEYRVKTYPEPQSVWDFITEGYSRDFAKSSIKKEMGEEVYYLYNKVNELKAINGIPQTRLPFDISIK